MTEDRIHRPPTSEDTRASEELFEIALGAPDEEDDAYWNAVCELRRRGTRDVFQMAARLTAHAEAWQRSLGVNVLAQLGVEKWTFPEDAERVLLDVYSTERDPVVLENLGFALGRSNGKDSVAALLALSRHENPDIRFAATDGLGVMEDDAALARLIELTEDASADVRDWATFYVAGRDVDTPEIRDVLLQRTTDEDDDARGEALKGLAQRKDPRVLEPLLKELAEHPGYFAFDAAEALADPRLYPALKRLETSGDVHDRGLAEALEACRPRAEATSEVPRK